MIFVSQQTQIYRSHAARYLLVGTGYVIDPATDSSIKGGSR